MNKIEAENILLKDLLFKCKYTISFLHSCLTDTQYEYAYPEQTIKVLQTLQKNLGTRKLCSHSFYDLKCDSCKERYKYDIKLNKAKKVMEKL